MEKPTNYTAYVKELFENKKAGDTFTVNMFGMNIGIVRATISANAKQDYRTRHKHGVLTATIIADSKV